jgi:hypothetical protein
MVNASDEYQDWDDLVRQSTRQHGEDKPAPEKKSKVEVGSKYYQTLKEDTDRYKKGEFEKSDDYVKVQGTNTPTACYFCLGTIESGQGIRIGHEFYHEECMKKMSKAKVPLKLLKQFPNMFSNN